MIADLPKFDGPQIPRSFGLRTMLIAMTALATVLGLIVWLTS